MENVQRAFACRGGNILWTVEHIGIHAVADRESIADHFAGVRIHHHQRLGIRVRRQTGGGSCGPW